MSRASEREKNKCFDEYGSVTFRPSRKLRQTDHPANQRDIRGYRNVTLPKIHGTKYWKQVPKSCRRGDAQHKILSIYKVTVTICPSVQKWRSKRNWIGKEISLSKYFYSQFNGCFYAFCWLFTSRSQLILKKLLKKSKQTVTFL